MQVPAVSVGCLFPCCKTDRSVLTQMFLFVSATRSVQLSARRFLLFEGAPKAATIFQMLRYPDLAFQNPGRPPTTLVLPRMCSSMVLELTQWTGRLFCAPSWTRAPKPPRGPRGPRGLRGQALSRQLPEALQRARKAELEAGRAGSRHGSVGLVRRRQGHK